MGSEWSAYRTCPSRDRLNEFLNGKLSEHESVSVEKHIDECENCLGQLSELNSAQGGIEQYLKNLVTQDEIFLEPQFKALQTRVGKIELARDRAWTKTNAVDSTKVIRRTVPTRLREYEILHRLGEGGMGDVYAARHVLLDKIVAIKFLADQHTRKPERVGRFQNEMKAIGSLNHPNVVAARDAGEFEGRYYLVMEYVDGLDVSRLVESHGYLRESDAAEIARQTAEGLHYIHNANRIHRDIKPSNLMISKNGDVQILDLGLAKFSLFSEQENAQTKTGYLLGTLDYMAPEQADNSSQADIRSDTYSLGCCLYKLVTGSAPFESSEYDSTYAKLDAHRKLSAPSVRELRPELSIELDAVIQQLLAKDPAARFQSPAEIASALEPLTQGSDLRGLVEALPDERTTLGADVKKARSPVVSRPQAQAINRKAIIVGLAFAAVVLVAVLAVVTRSTFWGAKKVAPNLISSAVRVDPLIWDDDSRSSNWSVSEDSAITIQSDDVSLLGIGDTTDNVNFVVDIKQLPWSRQIGVFFGYNVIDGEGTYQSLEIESVQGRKFQVVRYRRSFLENKPLRQNSEFLASVTIDDPEAVSQLGFTIQNGQLTSVTIDEKKLPELCRIEPNKTPSSAGRVGVFANNSTGRFTNLKVDSRRIDLK